MTSFMKRILLVCMVFVLEDQPLAQILSCLIFQMTHFCIMLSAPNFRRSEMINETVILLTIYALMPCTNQFTTN